MTIPIVSNPQLISPARAAKVASRRARGMGAHEASPSRTELHYKKLYFYKVLALAARTPFPPKKVGYTLFYDAVTNQSGLTESIPSAQEQEVDSELILPERYSLDAFEERWDDEVERHILRSYLLKRPKLYSQGVEEVYLPYWVCSFSPDIQVTVNAATGRVNV